MASIGKLMPSAANFQVEISPAIANLNFDFSLYKVQPPVEFEGVGSALSCLRREEAEGGRSHITARKLGALFGALLPSIPQLIKTYGNRASEISQASSITQQGRNAYGPFGSRAGADATSLWAAATSGKEAIAVHLLACMLARIWERSEATSIWVEIVERRKQDIIANFDKDNFADLASLAAARQDLTRMQLAEWDASARAWLGAADIVKSRQQKQLSLIIDNVRAPVNRECGLFQSVMTAWTDGMTQMEGLVTGISQKAHTGGILLALSAWHLYPDMMVVVPCVTHVRQKDPMFASGGVVTIGLEKPCSDQKGVFWSLPLAHLRHYGAPVVSVRSLDSGEQSRLSLTELLQATLGCVLHGWGTAGSNTMETVGWLANLSDLLNDAASAGNILASLMIRGDAEASWLNLMLLAAKYYLECSGQNLVLAKALVCLGRRHGRAFLGLPSRPLFGLQHRGAFTGLLESEERKVKFLRSIAFDFASKQKYDACRGMFIRYRRHYTGCQGSVYEYATAVPWKIVTSKRKFDQLEADIVGHARWLYAGGDLTRRCLDAGYLKRLEAKCGHNSGIGTSHTSVEMNSLYS